MRKNGSTKSQGLYKIFPSTNGGESGKMARGTTTNHKACTRQSPSTNGGESIKWREGPHWFLRTTNKTAPLGATKYWKRKYQSLLLLLFFLVLDSFYFVLFCIINHGDRLIHELSKISLFLAWKTGVDLYMNRLIHEKIRYFEMGSEGCVTWYMYRVQNCHRLAGSLRTILAMLFPHFDLGISEIN